MSPSSPPLIGSEIELPLLPDDPKKYRETLEELWNDLVTTAGSDWHIDRDSGTGGITGMSNHTDPHHPSICYDASTLLLEFALPPRESLGALNAMWKQYQTMVFPVLRKHGIRILGVGMQPLIDINAEGIYDAWKTPKAISRVVKVRGWDHRWNLRCASTQPAIDVPLDDAIGYVNYFEKALPLLQTLCANSAVEHWKTDPKIAEKRDYLGWSQMMKKSSDMPCIGMPRTPYRDLADYLSYLFAIPIYFLTTGDGNYKKASFVSLKKQTSLLQLLEREEHDGEDLHGNPVIVRTSELAPMATAQVDWYSFRPVRLRYRLTEIRDWNDFRERLKENPESLFAKIFLEIRSLATQLPGEEMVNAALITGLLRGRKTIEKYLEAFSWNAIADFYYGAGPRYEAWQTSLGGRPFTAIIVELIEMITDALAPEDRVFLEKVRARARQGTSPAILTKEALANGKDAFLSFITYPAP